MPTLHQYQTDAVDFVLEHKSVFLAMDMGLGKTAVSLAVIHKTGLPAMVFGPLNAILFTWPDEIKKWTPLLTYKVLHGKDKDLSDINQYDILLMNYEGLSWLSKQICRWKRRTVVYDESSMCKSHSTARFNLLRKMSHMWTDYRMCLSATPSPNGLHELWSQYYLLDQGRSLGKSVSKFRDTYCASFSYPGKAFTEYKVRPEKVKEIYEAVAPRTFRLKAEDHLNMPSLIYNSIPCKLPDKLAKKYKQIEDEFFLELENKHYAEVLGAGGASLKLRQFIQGGVYDEEKAWHALHEVKLSRLREFYETMNGNPFICTIQFKGELEAIRKYFPDTPLIAGGTKVEDRRIYIEAWNKGELPMLLCHPRSLSHAANLQFGGHTVFWYGLTWSLEEFIQLNGRVYRQGQKNGVVIHQLVMKDTVDEAVMKAIENKATTQGELLEYLRAYRRSL